MNDDWMSDALFSTKGSLISFVQAAGFHQDLSDLKKNMMGKRY